MEATYKGFVLAPSETQRIRYTRWLCVHGKKQVTVSARMKELWIEYQVRLSLHHGTGPVRHVF